LICFRRTRGRKKTGEGSKPRGPPIFPSVHAEQPRKGPAIFFTAKHQTSTPRLRTMAIREASPPKHRNHPPALPLTTALDAGRTRESCVYCLPNESLTHALPGPTVKTQRPVATPTSQNKRTSVRRRGLLQRAEHKIVPPRRQARARRAGWPCESFRAEHDDRFLTPPFTGTQRVEQR